MNPHKSKPYICILDLLFTMFNKGVKNASVNNKTKNMAQPEAMAQLGLVLKWMIKKCQTIVITAINDKRPRIKARTNTPAWRSGEISKTISHKS